MTPSQEIFNIVLAVAGMFGGWYMKAIWESLKELKAADDKLTDQISGLKVMVAGDYVRRESFDKLSEALFSKLDRIENKLDGKVDKP